jgi:hypothetical protein
MMMVNDDKNQTNPAPKNAAHPKNKNTSGADPSKAEESGEKVTASPSRGIAYELS